MLSKPPQAASEPAHQLIGGERRVQERGGGESQNGCQAPFWVLAFSCFLLFFLLFGGYQGLLSDFLLFIFKLLTLFPPPEASKGREGALFFLFATRGKFVC